MINKLGTILISQSLKKYMINKLETGTEQKGIIL